MGVLPRKNMERPPVAHEKTKYVHVEEEEEVVEEEEQDTEEGRTKNY